MDSAIAVGFNGSRKLMLCTVSKKTAWKSCLKAMGLGALASLPWFGKPEESIIPGTEIKP